MIEHPSVHIAPQLVTTIRSLAAEAEGLKQLHPQQLQLIYEQRWFQLFVPKAYQGLELDLPNALQLEEALAWTDGSLGWTVTLCAGAGWFVGFLDKALAAVIFSDRRNCLAGSGKASGIARQTATGYTITGHWDYATGANHATAFTANCIIEVDGQLLKNMDGSPVVQSFLLLPNEVTIHKSWKQVGMLATGSNSFEANNIVVDKNRTFLINSNHAILEQPIYQFPFLQFAETTLAVNSSGMAMRFLDICKPLLQSKSPTIHASLTAGIQHLEDARKIFYATATRSWKACIAYNSIDAQLLQELSYASKQLAYTARRVVDELYPYCGMQAANPETEINRVWRNLHTASQHSLFNG